MWGSVECRRNNARRTVAFSRHERNGHYRPKIFLSARLQRLVRRHLCRVTGDHPCRRRSRLTLHSSSINVFAPVGGNLVSIKYQIVGTPDRRSILTLPRTISRSRKKLRSDEATPRPSSFLFVAQRRVRCREWQPETPSNTRSLSRERSRQPWDRIQ